MRLVVTGGSGFIGSAIVRRAVGLGIAVVNVDKMTYAATEGSTASVADSALYEHVRCDVADTPAILSVLATHQPDAVMHLAAETHVDRSIDRPADFITTNVVGTTSMLSAATAYFETLTGNRRERFRFHHISTDEVFGSLGQKGRFNATSPYDPRSPYAASKAGADHFVRAWFHTFGLPVVVTNCSNNYGPFQFPEKLIPLVTVRALTGQTLPVYGDGSNVRDWLFVDDHADALLKAIDHGEPGSTYVMGGDSEFSNIDVVRSICSVLDDVAPAADGSPHASRISFVTDRPGHDFRYAIDSSDTNRSLGWSPSHTFEDGLERTIRWYVDNEAWWRPLVEAAVERVGLAGQRRESEI